MGVGVKDLTKVQVSLNQKVLGKDTTTNYLNFSQSGEKQTSPDRCSTLLRKE